MRKIKNLAVGVAWVGVQIAALSGVALADSINTQKRVVIQAAAGDQLSVDAQAVDDKIPSGKPCDTSKTAKPEATCPFLHLAVTDQVVKDQLKTLHKGDYFQVSYSTDSTKNQNVLKTIGHYVTDSVDSPFWVLLGSAAVCLLLYNMFSGFKPTQLIIGEDNRYSNSKFQMAVWFFVLITSYVAALWMRLRSGGWDFLGGVDIPKNLLLLSGLSALTFGGAKAITSSKDTSADGKTKNPEKPNFFRDLTHNDGDPTANPPVPPQFDFGDFQMVVVTLIAVATYIALIFNFLGTVEYSKAVSLPDVDTTILATFGLGQGAYLTKKAVGEVAKS